MRKKKGKRQKKGMEGGMKEKFRNKENKLRMNERRKKGREQGRKAREKNT